MKIRRLLKLSRMIALLMGLLIIANHLTAQQDTTLRFETVNADSSVSYLTPMQYAFMLHEETNWLMKANLLITSANRASSYLKFSLEKRISRRFSINAVLLNYEAYNVYVLPIDFYNYGLQFLLEPRWYYQSQKDRNRNKPVSHLSGPYLSVSAGYQTFEDSDNDGELYLEQEYIPVYVKWGLQRRFLKRGYLDIGVSAGYRFSMHDPVPSSFSLKTYAEAGLALTRDKQKLDFDKLCPVLRCQAADKLIFKINLMDAVGFSYFRNYYYSMLIPNIGAEFKIGESPFSVNTMLSLKTEYGFSTKYDYNVFRFYPEFLLEGRWYYNLNRRILNGKSGNGLSANYFSFGAFYSGEYLTSHHKGNTQHEDITFVGLRVSTGIQRLISKHLYYDLNFGYGYGKQIYHQNNSWNSSSKFTSRFNLGIAIGYRF